MPKSEVYGLRCSQKLFDQCDELVEKVADDERLSPRGIATRADVMRLAIVRGLPMLRRERAKSK